MKMTAAEGEIPKIAVLGSGIFARTQYIPRLREIADLVDVKTIWSRTEDSAKAAAELARDFCPNIEFKWGDAGLDDIILDDSIHGVAIVLAGQIQVDMSLKMLKAGKHVIQATNEAETALSSYKSLRNHFSHQPIWAVAENYRFEPAFVEGGFILDMGVHFIAGLRMLVGCEIATVSAIARHVDTNLPPPDNLCSLFQLENGCAGVFVMAVSSPSPKVNYVPGIDGIKVVVLRYVGELTVQKEHFKLNVGLRVDGTDTRSHPSNERMEEKFAMVEDVLKKLLEAKPNPMTLEEKETTSSYGRGGNPNTFRRRENLEVKILEGENGMPPLEPLFREEMSIGYERRGADFYPTTRPEAEPRSSYLEGVRDVAVLEAMLDSSSKNGALTHVKRF
ncbi:hypothetical protein M5K25_024832 [Dendrobium thyrsiflorum]|uniref:Gfo/Idh/MocA-like oxidoreductase N-terminal domain-containing protein n=1 Tax=Dendrobium thyrsiflorum TaxID=117978 RepID=A0ABD0U316_DENTH